MKFYPIQKKWKQFYLKKAKNKEKLKQKSLAQVIFCLCIDPPMYKITSVLAYPK